MNDRVYNHKRHHQYSVLYMSADFLQDAVSANALGDKSLVLPPVQLSFDLKYKFNLANRPIVMF